MEKIKVSLELTDIWNREDYRQLCYNIKNKLYDTCDVEYELWVITTNDNPMYVNAVAGQLGIPPDKIIFCTNNSVKIGQIVLNTDIHFDGDNSVVSGLEVTTVEGILVDVKLDYQKIGYKYISDFGKYSDMILREKLGEDGDKTKPC
jgi:hypothetical protein